MFRFSQVLFFNTSCSYHIFVIRYSCNTLPSRRTLKNSRLVCKKDDVHVCIMCLRAIMNYQVSPSHMSLRTEFTPLTDHVSLLCGSSAHLLVCMLQYGFNMVMSHPHAVNEIALSLNNKSPR